MPNVSKPSAAWIVQQVAELADIAAAKDIDVAVVILGSVARALNIDPETIATYQELSKL